MYKFQYRNLNFKNLVFFYTNLIPTSSKFGYNYLNIFLQIFEFKIHTHLSNKNFNSY